MDTPITPTPEQSTGRVFPDVMPPAQTPEQAPRPAPAEVAQPGAAIQNSGQPVAAAPALTRDDVAAAIAAMPAPATPMVPMPGFAADQDVVEPEWVDAAEQVIAQTAGNPHAEEEGFEALQVDYLKKRYDHDVKRVTDA